MFLAERVMSAGAAIGRIQPLGRIGKLDNITGMSLRVVKFEPALPLGSRIVFDAGPMAEVVGFSEDAAEAVAFGPLEGLSPGAIARLLAAPGLAVSDAWLSRVLDPLGNPLDGRPAPPPGPRIRSTRTAAPPAGTRGRLGPRIDLGVRALDLFAPIREGQRLGLFAASGVGKSTLLSMLAASAPDVVVFGLVGERGRELREFIEDDLGPEALARAVIVCATSDTAPAMRREAAFAAMTVAEHFRDQGRRVLLMLDSVTRFAMAQREIGLAAGEPPATRGHPPSVFAELPRLLERAGPGPQGCAGSITGLFTVLVEGDDHDEPIADAVRGILDGHVVLDRRIGEAGRYPAIDVLRSLSRTAPGCLPTADRPVIAQARAVLALAAEMTDLVRLGAWRPGADPAADRALRLAPRIEAVLRQDRDERPTAAEAIAALADALDDEAHGA